MGEGLGEGATNTSEPHNADQVRRFPLVVARGDHPLVVDALPGHVEPRSLRTDSISRRT
jgi:hypothetical protein